jgi:hypothetical protein
MNEEGNETIGGETPEVAPDPTPEPEPTPEPTPEPEIISGPPPADHPEVQEQSPQSVAEEALEHLRRGLETLKSHSAARTPGSLIYDAAVPLEKSYEAFKKLMGK